MKRYELALRHSVTPRSPIIIRVDGKAFHTYTRPLKNPFDKNLSMAMVAVAKALCSGIQGAQLAYTQSDEVSVLVHAYKRFDSSCWFDGQVQKMASVSAAIAAGVMTANSDVIFGRTRIAAFDSRVIVIPENDVCNYFVWRQQDCIRNSVQGHARTMFSHRECHKKDQEALKTMCRASMQPWEDLDPMWRYGIVVEKRDGDRAWQQFDAYPPFQDDRLQIERHLDPEEM